MALKPYIELSAIIKNTIHDTHVPKIIYRAIVLFYNDLIHEQIIKMGIDFCSPECHLGIPWKRLFRTIHQALKRGVITAPLLDIRLVSKKISKTCLISADQSAYIS